MLLRRILGYLFNLLHIPGMVQECHVDGLKIRINTTHVIVYWWDGDCKYPLTADGEYRFNRITGRLEP